VENPKALAFTENIPAPHFSPLQKYPRVENCKRKMQRLQHLQNEAVWSAATFIREVSNTLKMVLDHRQVVASSSGTCALAWQIQRSNWICLDFFVTFFIKKKSK